ncbi:protein-ADP-ribose hydrolase [Archangium gephyra]|uniref:protein-ADP-ribose hydrolase n=1 Tax=Archangium gephyra TaxID=48 RepID=UPI003B7CD764
MSASLPPLSLDTYRALVGLDTPFAPPPPVGPGEHAALVQRLLAQLGVDGTTGHLHEALEARGMALGGLDSRTRLRALLTVRGPTPLPDAFHHDLDRLLLGEAQARPRVTPTELPRLGDGRAAARCALWQGDITTLAVDAITNAANEQLLGCFQPFHPCIDNAIHCAAGPRLREDCAHIMALQGRPEPTGTAKATRGYNLPARFVLHTVGPIVRGPVRPEHAEALASSYRACLDLAAALPGVRSVALCAVSTGVFGYPKGPAARVALAAVGTWLRAHPGTLDLVVFNVFSDSDRAAYAQALSEGVLERATNGLKGHAVR